MAMGTNILVTTEDDATPFVLMVAALLRRAADARGWAKTVAGLEGVYSYRSPNNNGAATIRFAKGQVRVERGVSRDTETVVINDLNRILDPNTRKPQVKGSRRLSVTAGKVLESAADTWQEGAELFWPAMFADPDVPRPVLVTATDTQESDSFGPNEPAVLELRGPSYRLAALFTGLTWLGAELRQGDIGVIGSATAVAALSHRSLAWTLGEQA